MIGVGVGGPGRSANRIATSHPYCDVVEKKGQTSIVDDDRIVTYLAKACLSRAVDQEIVSDADIVKLADRPLKIPVDECETSTAAQASLSPCQTVLVGHFSDDLPL